MLRDRYEPEDIFARVPQMVQRIDPVLKHLDVLLEDDELYEQVRTDFGKRHRFSLVQGRHSTPVEVLLRMLLLKHLFGWSYQETEDRVDESLVLRWFCRLFWEPTPDDTTLLRWANTLRPETLHQPGRPRGPIGQAGEGDAGAQSANVSDVCADDHSSPNRQ